MPPVTPQLFLSTKNSASDGRKESQLILYRALERWSSQLTSQAGAGVGISQITSTGGTVTITNPTGPVTNLEVIRTPYASITGPGYSSTPGDLTQAGGFTVNDTVGTMGVLLGSSAANVSLSSSGTATGIHIGDSASGVGSAGVTITTQNYGITETVNNNSYPLTLQAGVGAARSSITINTSGVNLNGQANGVLATAQGPIGLFSIATPSSTPVMSSGTEYIASDKGIQLYYQYTSSTPSAPGLGLRIADTPGGAAASIYVTSAANPNTANLAASGAGDLCISTASGGSLWQASAFGYNWIQFTRP